MHFFEISKAIILGIVEGITEFLPISSTGHLILINQFLSFDENFTKLFDIVIQLGAILAVVIYFFKKLWPFSGDEAKNKNTWSIWYKTFLAVIPALIVGAIFSDFVEKVLFNPFTVAISLIVGGVIIIFVENNNVETKFDSLEKLSFKNAFLIGLFQCIALVPGVSRSASTIVGATLLGGNRIVATEFSFFLAIPTMVAATSYSMLKYKGILTNSEYLVLAFGFITALITALLVIRFLMNFIQKNSFKSFGYYRIILGIIIISYFVF
jgi:undecaprenyl-diphosphatase